jgi:hypothetical protein
MEGVGVAVMEVMQAERAIQRAVTRRLSSVSANVPSGPVSIRHDDTNPNLAVESFSAAIAMTLDLGFGFDDCS